MILNIKKTNSRLVFPQANDIHKVIKFVDEMAYHNYKNTLKRINMDFVDRQKSYYKSAAKFLGLIEKNKPTKLGEQIFKSDKDTMMLSIVNLILNQEIFYKYYIHKDVNQVINSLKSIYQMNDTTAIRRSYTVKAWVSWCVIILDQNDEKVEVNINGFS